MKIAFFANPDSAHDVKWINRLATVHDVVVICGAREPSGSIGLDPGIRVESLLSAYSVMHVNQTRRQAKQVHALCAAFRPDIVHSMYAVPNAIWGDSVSSGNHVITTRGSDLLIDLVETLAHPKSLAQLFSFPILRYRVVSAIRRAAYVTSTSVRQRHIAAQIRGSLVATEVIRTGVDPSVFTCAAKDACGDPFILLSPRSMKPLYNIDLLVTAVASLARAGLARRVILRLIDDHPGSEYAHMIRELVQVEGIAQDVEFLPQMDEAQMRLHYEMADAVIMTPRSDGTPVSAIEAMLMRRPLIVGNLDYDADLFSGSTVWKVPSFSPKDVSDTLAQVIGQKEQRQAKVQRAYEAAQQHANLGRSLDTLSRIYAQIHMRGTANQP